MQRRVLFLMPNWKAYSEPWMLSMMEAVGESLVGICVLAYTNEKLWRNVPVYSLNAIRFSFFNHVKARFFGKHHYTDNGILQEILKKQKIDIVFGQYGTFVSTFEETWNRSDVKLYIQMHGFDAHVALKDVQSGALVHDVEYKNRLKRLSQRASILANSNYTKTLLEKDFGIDQQNITVKYLGVPKSDFQKQHTEKKSVSIVYIGRLIDFKAPQITIQAFDLACKKGLAGTLTLVGDGHLRNKCERLRDQSEYRDRIFILGSLPNDDALKHLQSADIFTQHNVVGEFSGQTECLGISILEAMNYGIPVVGTRSGGVDETVQDGITGLKVAPGDMAGHADALLKLANDFQLRQTMGTNAKKRVEEMFSLEKERKVLDSFINSRGQDV